MSSGVALDEIGQWHRGDGRIVTASEFADLSAQRVGFELQAADQNLHSRDERVGFLYGEYFLELMLCQAFASIIGAAHQSWLGFRWRGRACLPA